MYIEANNKYIEFLVLSLKHTRLGVTEFSEESPDLTPEEVAQQRVLYDMLTSIFERTFFLYEADKKKDSAEWRTWDLWMSKFIDKSSYREYLNLYAFYGCFGGSFQNYLKNKIEERRNK